MAIGTCVFDLGETLMSIGEGHDEESRLSHLLQIPIRQVRTLISRATLQRPGQTMLEFHEQFCRLVGENRSGDLDIQIWEIWQESVKAAVLSPGAVQILDALRQSGRRLGLVSNTSPISHLIIDHLDLRRRFDAVVFSCDVGYSKPDPRIFRIALKSLEASPEDVVVFGDRIRTDILGAAILGTRSILVETRARSIVEDGRSYVDAIVPDLLCVFRTEFYKRELV